MNSILGSVSTGVSRAGIRAVIAAQEKIGKTTLCSFAPAPLIVPMEIGYASIACAKTQQLTTLEQVNQLIKEIMTAVQVGQFPFKTLVFDSATALERFIHDAVLRRDPTYTANGKKMTTMESAHGGYGRATTMANSEFDEFLEKCDWLSLCGINIILTCHVFSSKVMDPTAGEYDSWDLQLHSPKNQKNYGKRERVTQWADLIGFLYEPVFVTTDGKLSKAISQNKGRVLGVSRTPGYVAGNRYNIVGEIPIPPPPANGWNYLANAIYNSTGNDFFTR